MTGTIASRRLGIIYVRISRVERVYYVHFGHALAANFRQQEQ